MHEKNYQLTLLLALFTVSLLLGGCGGVDKTAYQGPVYPPVTKVAPVFELDKVPASCKVFAHSLFMFPANQSGRQIAAAVTSEAGAKGANMILLGMSRQGAKENMDYKVAYFGPDQEYLCLEGWCGWKYGYELWQKQKDWVGIGYAEWGNDQVTYNHSLVLQAAFLRCE